MKKETLTNLIYNELFQAWDKGTPMIRMTTLLNLAFNNGYTLNGFMRTVKRLTQEGLIVRLVVSNVVYYSK